MAIPARFAFLLNAYGISSENGVIVECQQGVDPQATEAIMSYTELSLLEFQRRFSSEEACQEAMEQARWPEGFVCPRCGHGRASRIQTRRLLQCAGCHYQASLTAGTILHKTRTPLVKWFWAIWMVAQDKGGTSAVRLSRQLDLGYRTAWTMLHKLRKAMGQRDAGYTLTGSIEMDDAYFGGAVAGKKRGRGSPNKTPVAVMVENHGRARWILADQDAEHCQPAADQRRIRQDRPWPAHPHRRVERLQRP